MEMIKNVAVCIPKSSDQQFTKALEILCLRPHSVNKKVVGASLEKLHNGESPKLDFDEGFSLRRKVIHKGYGEDGKSIVSNEQIKFTKQSDGTLRFTLETEMASQSHSNGSNPCSFAICKTGDKLVFETESDNANSRGVEAARKCFEAVSRWCKEDYLVVSDPALRLIDLEKYNDKYNELKAKYGKRLVQV